MRSIILFALCLAYACGEDSDPSQNNLAGNEAGSAGQGGSEAGNEAGSAGQGGGEAGNEAALPGKVAVKLETKRRRWLPRRRRRW